MDKTTVYQDELKAAVKRAARQRVSEAQVIRESIGRRSAAPSRRRAVYMRVRAIARRIDELLAGLVKAVIIDTSALLAVSTPPERTTPQCRVIDSSTDARSSYPLMW